KGLAHITGGGMLDNIPRILPKNCNAFIEKGKWEILPVFNLLQQKGKIDENEMYRVFNMGIGMVAIVSQQYADSIVNELYACGEKAYIIGKITEGKRVVIIK
ncbi:phosphoribosylformylglycinamidine cyclo-ligase, partial [Candidatus Poribacteria bacterium]|nr:phosphoribosylformylglycinamidine cyclo-ligase [Candidatus Poribacteria bacterium]